MINEMKARAYDLMRAQALLSQELTQIKIAIEQLEKKDDLVPNPVKNQVPAGEIGTPGVPTTDGSQTGENN